MPVPRKPLPIPSWPGLIFTLGLVIILAVSPSRTASPNQPPNVLFITIDTLRADHLGCYGYRKIETPNIDRLAAEGVRFTRAYTPVPVTLPAHAVMFTGSYPMRTGMHDFSGNRLSAGQPLSTKIRTLAESFKRDGYATGAVVKLTAGEETQWQMLRSGSSYLSPSELILTFGLGQRTQADLREVRWPSGQVNRLEKIAADQPIKIQEGGGQVAAQPLQKR